MYEKHLLRPDDDNPIRGMTTRALVERAGLYSTIGAAAVGSVRLGVFGPAPSTAHRVAVLLALGAFVMAFPGAAELWSRALLWWRTRHYRATADRGQIQLQDALLTLLVLISMLTLAPVIYQFIGMVRPEADPFSALLLGLVIPLLFMTLLLTMGVSAQGGG